MTRDEAHRRAIEAGARVMAKQAFQSRHAGNSRVWTLDEMPAWIDKYWEKFVSDAEAAVAAYLAAMVLPISEIEDQQNVLAFNELGWEAIYSTEKEEMMRVFSQFTFLPEPPK